MVPWAGLQCVIVVFPDHTAHVLFSLALTGCEFFALLIGVFVFLCDTLLVMKVSKGAKIRNRYNQVPHIFSCFDNNGI